MAKKRKVSSNVPLDSSKKSKRAVPTHKNRSITSTSHPGSSQGLPPSTFRRPVVSPLTPQTQIAGGIKSKPKPQPALSNTTTDEPTEDALVLSILRRFPLPVHTPPVRESHNVFNKERDITKGDSAIELTGPDDKAPRNDSAPAILGSRAGRQSQAAEGFDTITAMDGTNVDTIAYSGPDGSVIFVPVSEFGTIQNVLRGNRKRASAKERGRKPSPEL